MYHLMLESIVYASVEGLWRLNFVRVVPLDYQVYCVPVYNAHDDLMVRCWAVAPTLLPPPVGDIPYSLAIFTEYDDVRRYCMSKVADNVFLCLPVVHYMGLNDALTQECVHNAALALAEQYCETDTGLREKMRRAQVDANITVSLNDLGNLYTVTHGDYSPYITPYITSNTAAPRLNGDGLRARFLRTEDSRPRAISPLESRVRRMYGSPTSHPVEDNSFVYSDNGGRIHLTVDHNISFSSDVHPVPWFSGEGFEPKRERDLKENTLGRFPKKEGIKCPLLKARE